MAGCEMKLKMSPICVVDTASVLLYTPQPRRRRFRHQLRSVDFFLLEAIERMTGTPDHTVRRGHFFCVIAQLFVYNAETGGGEGAGPKLVNAAPDCEFDEHPGFPCSSKQLKRIKRAAKDGKTLRHY